MKTEKSSPTVKEIESLKAGIEFDKHELARLEGVIEQLKGSETTLQEMKAELETLLSQKVKLEKQFEKALAEYKEEFDHE